MKNWLEKHGGIVIIIGTALAFGLVIALTYTLTCTLFLTDPKEEQIVAIYSAGTPNWDLIDLDLAYVSQEHAYYELTISYVWWKTDEVENYLEDLGLDYVKHCEN